MELLFPIVAITLMLFVIGYVKLREWKGNRGRPRKQKWEGETAEEAENRARNTKRYTDIHRGNGLGGGSKAV
ncbi:hypothetical protein ACFFGV_13200 [Pontibacillus salicampi]|uniref:Uncharacterized protein n=1 Tax=Pontibacillus salicampi TaxID=1449801 RepID=A0ABV6LQ33_9BACI